MSERVQQERSQKDGQKKKFDLRARIEQVMKGFHGVNAIAYKHKNEYVTYSRPADILRVSSDDEFTPDKKELWPVLNDMNAPLPLARLARRPNRVDDPDWTAPVSQRTPIIPEPVFPQSKGLKLRPIDEIINDKKLFGLPETTTKNTPTTHRNHTHTTTNNTTTTTNNVSKPKALEAPLSKVQGVLDIITEAARKPAKALKSTAVARNRSKEINLPLKSTNNLSTPSANRPRKPSLLKSEITSEDALPPKPKMGSKKPMASMTNQNITNRPRVSSKSTLPQKNKYNHDIPDLIEARNYILGEIDEIEFKKLEHLAEAIIDSKTSSKPILPFRFDLFARDVRKSKKKEPTPPPVPPPVTTTAGKTVTKPEKVKTITVNKKTNNSTDKTAFPTKTKQVTSTPPPISSVPIPANTIKKSLSDRSQSTHTPAANIASTPPTTTTPSDKQAYPSSIPASFLRSMKIPKRKASDIELEEGETISPSPSPLHTTTVTPTLPLPTPPPMISTPPTKTKPEKKRLRTEEPEEEHTPVTSSESSRKRESKREEERSSSRRSDRHDDRSNRTTKSHRSSHYRSKSRSRSRSPPPPSRRSPRSSSRRRHNSSDSIRRRPRSSDKRKSTDDKHEDNGSTNKRQRTDSGRELPSREKDTKSTTIEKDVAREKDAKYTTTTTSKKPSPTPSSTTSISSEKTVSATAPNAETPEQFKVFSLMFNKLALANKRRGDTQTNPIFGIIDHFHAFCDYILNFYYIDRLNVNASFKQTSTAWKSIFPFTDSLLKKLESRKEHELLGLCIRLNSLIRFYMYSRMEASTRPVLQQQINNANEKMTDRACVELSENLLHEYEKAERAYKDSEKHLTYATLVTKYPETFKNVCMEGNLLTGITLGGEAGVSVGPMFPFTPYSPLHHAAIVSKCILSEYVTKNALNYTPISQPEEFM